MTGSRHSIVERIMRHAGEERPQIEVLETQTKMQQYEVYCKYLKPTSKNRIIRDMKNDQRNLN